MNHRLTWLGREVRVTTMSCEYVQKRRIFGHVKETRPRRGLVFEACGIFRCGAIPLIAPHWTGPFKSSRQRLCGRRFNRTAAAYTI